MHSRGRSAIGATRLRIERPIFGREAELSEIEGFLSGHDHLPSALLIEGEAGIGKTTLWEHGTLVAGGRGFEVLRCSAASSEARTSFAALSDLMGGLLDRVLEDLPPPQGRALRIALLLEDSGEQPHDQRAVGMACVSALQALAAHGPVLVAIDDAQWLDRPSSTAIAFLLRRLGGLPVGLLLGVRIEGVPGVPLGVDRGLGEDRVRRLFLDPLSRGAIHALIRERAGVVLSRPTLRELHAISGGNPFFALEIAHALKEKGMRPAPGDPLPIPGNLQELLGARVRSLPAEVREVLLLTACLPDPPLSLLTRAVRQGGGRVEAIDEALEAGSIVISGGRVRPAHPLLASAMYSTIGPTRRRQVHGRLVGLVEDAEQRAWHLALAAEGPDEEIAAQLAEAARRAFARGAPSAAAELCEQSRRLTPEGEDQLGTRTLLEADYLFAAGDAVGASRLLEEALVLCPTGRVHAEALGRLARLRYFDTSLRSAADLFMAALAVAEDEPRLRADLEEGLAWALLLMREDLPGALAHATSAVQQAEAAGDETLLAQALAVRGLSEFHLGHRDARETMHRALGMERSVAHLRVLRHPSFAHAYMLGRTDDLDTAREKLDELRHRAGNQGDDSALPAILTHLGWVEFMAGRWETAAGHAADGYEIALQTGQPPYAAELLSIRALVESHRGRMVEAREAAEAALVLAGTGRDDLDSGAARDGGAELALWALGALELSLGNLGEADRYLRPLSEAALRAGIREPGEMRFLPDHIEALARMGRHDEADRFLRHLEACAREQDRVSAQAAASRCRGLLLDARGDPAGALGFFQAALSEHDAALLPFERGRTLLAVGSTQRRLKRKRMARESLEAARQVFEELGAGIWTQITLSELELISGRAPFGGLTAAELRVAQLVAAGMTNPQVAANLFITLRTVETHLSHIYAKLGISSRVELVRAFVGGSLDLK